MDSLLKKLNTLVKASLKDLPGNTPSDLNPKKVTSQLDEIRKLLDNGFAYEETLQQKMKSYQNQIANLDARADQLIQTRQDQQARLTLQEIEKLQKQLAFTQSEYEIHQIQLQALFTQVSELESFMDSITPQKISIQVQTEPAEEKPIQNKLEDRPQVQSKSDVDDDMKGRISRLSKPGT
ncbi:hypothetical protein MASR2M15_11810 [Anaerolineales bacterium]